MSDPELPAIPIADKELPQIGSEISLFVKHVDSIGHVLIGLVFALQEVSKQSRTELHDFEDKTCTVEKDGGKRSVQVPNEHYREWKKLFKRLEHFDLSRDLLPRSLLVSLVSQYDAFLGRVLRTIFLKKPELLNGSDRKITFEALQHFSSIETAREYILEKEVETILRSSHSEQFKWMERAFAIPLTKDLKSWPTFVELTERRNLFVHTDGVVSSQYMAVCSSLDAKLTEGQKEGMRLGVPQDYFKIAHDCIYEIGVKLAHVLWRKLFPDEREKADNSLIATSYELIEGGRYPLAISLLDFGCDGMKSHANEITKLALIVNRAQAYKWSGDQERCKKIMKAVDWSAKSDNFRLADAVLREDWQEAAKLVIRIGAEGVVSALHYRDWPLFREFRKEEAFLDAYRTTFGVDFSKKSEKAQESVPEAKETPLIDATPNHEAIEEASRQ